MVMEMKRSMLRHRFMWSGLDVARSFGGWSFVLAALVLVMGIGHGTAADDLRIQPAAGDPLTGLSPDESDLFLRGRDAYQRNFTVEEGLGPIFNLPSCAACHSLPLGGAGILKQNDNIEPIP